MKPTSDAARDTGTETPIIDIERRLAEQEKVIADLNDMVVTQWRKIDSLERRLGELRAEFDEASRMGSGGPEKPPPHY